MQISHSTEIGAPIDHVFRACTDFARFEAAARNRGATVTRTDALQHPGPGMSWTSVFRMKGRSRSVTVELVKYEPPDVLAVRSVTGGLDGIAVLDLTALTAERTRIGVAIDLAAQSLAARLILQTLKLARPRLKRRLRQRVVVFADEIEAKWRAGRPES